MIWNIILILLIISLLIISAPFFKKLRLKEIVFISLLSALAAAGGASLRAIPGIQPTSFIIIFAGAAINPGAGVLCGLASSLLFDLMSTFSIYTPWRCCLWMLMGLFSVFFAKNRFLLAAYGFVWGILFNWILNSVWLIYGNLPFTFMNLIISCGASFLQFDLPHAICNAALILILYKPLKKIYLRRL